MIRCWGLSSPHHRLTSESLCGWGGGRSSRKVHVIMSKASRAVLVFERQAGRKHGEICMVTNIKRSSSSTRSRAPTGLNILHYICALHMPQPTEFTTLLEFNAIENM